MIKHLIPFDSTNSSNPYLINRKSGLLIGPENLPLSAEYIWSKQGKDRDDLVDYVFNHYRKSGFPFPKLSDSKLNASYEKIKNRSVDDIINANGEIINSNSTGSDIIKHFMGELFYSTKGSGKGTSCLAAFNDDEMFKEVLRNRMGYRTSKEDGTERPYIFSISDDMIIQGMRSSAIGFSTSQFKVIVAKYIHKKYGGEGSSVIDYSSGWGARALAAGSLNMKYVGIDPLTADKVNNLIEYFKIDGTCLKSGSENPIIFKDLKGFDLAWSSPPYWTTEIYSEDDSQCYIKYKNYDDWLKHYWATTVENCYNSLKVGGKFIVCVASKSGKFEIGSDMTNICGQLMKPIETVYIKTSQGHLSSKKETGKISKNTEAFYVFEK